MNELIMGQKRQSPDFHEKIIIITILLYSVHATAYT